jgi:uncharacterized protein with GYD domain
LFVVGIPCSRVFVRRWLGFEQANAKKLGIEIKEQYWCMGAYDGVLIFDAPDDEAATAGMLVLTSSDNVTTQTMRAFTATEIGKILIKTT